MQQAWDSWSVNASITGILPAREARGWGLASAFGDFFTGCQSPGASQFHQSYPRATKRRRFAFSELQCGLFEFHTVPCGTHKTGNPQVSGKTCHHLWTFNSLSAFS